MNTAKEFLTKLEELQREYNSEIVERKEFILSDKRKKDFLLKIEVLTLEVNLYRSRTKKILDGAPWKFHIVYELDLANLFLDNMRVFVEAIANGSPLVIFQDQLDKVSRFAQEESFDRLRKYYGDEIYEQRIIPVLTMTKKFADETKLEIIESE